MTQQTSNEAFEKWYINSKYQLSKDNTRLYLYEAWQAATAERDKLVIELQSKNSELSASINVLREALEFYNDAEFPYSIANDALTLTPAQHINDDVVIFDKKSLQAQDNEVIERCAKVCEKVEETTVECPELAIYCAEAIRALKHTS